MPQIQKLQRKSRNDRRKSAESLQHEGDGPVCKASLQITQKEISGTVKLTATKLSLGYRPPLLPDRRHGFTFLSPRNSVRVRCSASAPAAAGTTQMLLGSGTQRPGARPHTPRARAAPAEPTPHADWPRPEGRALRPGPRPEMSLRGHGPRRAARASRAASLALGLAGWLADTVAILSPGNSNIPHSRLTGQEARCPPQKWPPDWQGFISHMAKVYLG